MDDWLDMQVSLSSDCLQLSVSMPYLPGQDGQVVILFCLLPFISQVLLHYIRYYKTF